MPAVYPSSPVQLDLAAAGGFRSGRRHRGTAEVPELRGGWRGGPALVLVAAAIALAMVIGATLTRLGRHGAAPLDEVQPVIVVPAARPVERPLPKLVDLPVVTQLAAPAAEEEQEVRRVEARPAAAQEEQVARAHPAPVVHHSAPPAHHHHRPAARRERPASSTREAPRTVKQGRLVDPFSE
jgi:hypothetical protein